MSHAEQLVAEKSSVIIESRQEPDRYFLVYNEFGELCSPFTGEPVKEQMDKSSILGTRELNAFEQAETEGSKRDILGFWLSPPHERRSRQTKLIVYETSRLDGQRALLNRMLLFDIDYSAALGIANEIAEAFGDNPRFTDAEEVRENTIFAERKMEQNEWLEIITNIINDQRQWSMIENEEDIEIAERTVRWVVAGESEQYMGSNPQSCPPVASEVMGRHSLILEGKFVKKCGSCGREINKVIFKGYRCSCGGVYEGC